ncbi:MAG: Myb-like DNA-binding domain-containing protein [Actinomycetales bacterium]
MRARRANSHRTRRPKRESPPLPTSETATLRRVLGQWFADEDAALNVAISVHGTSSWARIASLVPGRDAKQCRERWHNALNPTINREPFSPEEDDLLWDSVLELGSKWSQIARERFLNRTENQVKLRHVTLKRVRTPGAVTPPPQPRKRKSSYGADGLSRMVRKLKPCELHSLFAEPEPETEPEPEPEPEPRFDVVQHFEPRLQPAKVRIEPRTPVTPAHAYKDHRLLPPPAKTSKGWMTMLLGSPTGCSTAFSPGGGPFSAINQAMRQLKDARKDGWDGLPLRFDAVTI